MAYLINTTEVYRVTNEAEAQKLIDMAKKSSEYSLTKFSSVHKEKKSKGEVIEEWYRVSLTKSFNEEKEPMRVVDIKYNDGFDGPDIEGDE